jgi:lipopolysaccharide transport system ATP-binding protein
LSDPPIIEFDDVSKDYVLGAWTSSGIKSLLLNWRQVRREGRERRTVHGLQNLTLSIQRGETFGVLGPNGSGKSTALGLIAGVLRPTSGEVHVRGRVSPLLELGAGFHPELTGRDNILLNGVLLGMRRRAVLANVDRIIDFSGLRDSIDHPLRTYSSGMTARLGFSVAVHLSPDLLLIDEVLAVGDAEFKERCERQIARFQSAGVTIVLVTHDRESALKLCGRAALLEHGRLVCSGPAAEVVARYAAMTKKDPPAAAPAPARPAESAPSGAAV